MVAGVVEISDHAIKAAFERGVFRGRDNGSMLRRDGDMRKSEDGNRKEDDVGRVT